MDNKYKICDDKNNKIYLVVFTSIYLKNGKDISWHKHSKELEDLYFSFTPLKLSNEHLYALKKKNFILYNGINILRFMGI